jgi:putative endonuclease
MYTILTNKWHTVLYTGVTGPIEQRIMEHKNKEIEGFTRRYNVTKLVFVEEFKYVNDVLEAEKRVKGWTRAKKIALIESVNPKWNELMPDGNTLPSPRTEAQTPSAGLAQHDRIEESTK